MELNSAISLAVPHSGLRTRVARWPLEHFHEAAADGTDESSEAVRTTASACVVPSLDPNDCVQR